MPIELCRAAIVRFGAACEREPLVVAAFLGGSFAAGTANEESDVDVYVVAREEDYAELWARRETFVRALGEPERLVELPNFEGLGFDMVHFELADGVTGEVAYGHTANFMALHGGPHEVLVDRTGLLDGVTFPLLPG
jgi:predicted nucleotidyltransferase